MHKDEVVMEGQGNERTEKDIMKIIDMATTMAQQTTHQWFIMKNVERQI